MEIKSQWLCFKSDSQELSSEPRSFERSKFLIKDSFEIDRVTLYQGKRRVGRERRGFVISEFEINTCE